ATALFANSPFLEGKPNGFLSYRSEMWKDVDKNRTGMLPFVFDDGFGFEAYVDYALDVPMYFVYRNGVYHDVTGLSFRDFLEGKLKGFEGEMPTLSDWADHLTTIFPEVRIKQFMEVRGADGGPWAKICALPALWVGLFYDQGALDAAYDIVKDWTQEERQALRNAVPKEGLGTTIRGRSVQDLAKEILEIATGGLEARDALDSSGGNEVHFLETLKEVASSGQTPAEALLEAYNGPWGGDIDPIFKECAY
ncbi:MAG: glutamate--cysteine ligase, partial [Alphaproteobacteria bacterium]